MPVTLPRVAPGQIITSESYNALAAEIEALNRRVDQLTVTVTQTPDPVVVNPAAPRVRIVGVGPAAPFNARSVGGPLELTGENFAADAAHTRVLVGDALATIKSATTDKIEIDIPLPNHP